METDSPRTRYVIPHTPLSVGADGVLAYPQLSQYYYNEADTRRWQVDTTLRQLELSAVRATICEIYARKWSYISRKQSLAFVKVLKHLARNTDSLVLKSQIGLVEHRVLELLGDDEVVRLGSCICSDCGASNPLLIKEPLKIKNCSALQHLKCSCGAVAMINSDGHVIGTLTSEFSWITRIQCMNVIGSYKAKRLYNEMEVVAYLSSQKEFLGNSVFQLNPLNRRANKAILGVLAAFGHRSKIVAGLSYQSEKQVAEMSDVVTSHSKGELAKFLAEVQTFEAQTGGMELPTIESVRLLCSELNDEDGMD